MLIRSFLRPLTMCLTGFEKYIFAHPLSARLQTGQFLTKQPYFISVTAAFSRVISNKSLNTPVSFLRPVAGALAG